MALLYHSIWVWALHGMRSLWSKPAVHRALDVLTGLALFALAARISGIFK
jgi:hypothetical protein